MSNSDTPKGVVIKVTCGETFQTTVGGVPVDIVCNADTAATDTWKLPEPPSTAGGVVAYLHEDMFGRSDRLNLSMLVDAARTGEVEDLAAVHDADAASPFVFESAPGTYLALDRFTARHDG